MRDHKRGIILVSTLLSLLLLASLAAVLQLRVRSNLTIAARLERAHLIQIAEASIRERLRGILGDAIAGLPVDIPGFNLRGDPFLMQEGGRTFEVRINDVDGLVDLYLGSPAMLAGLPSSSGVSESARQDMLQGLEPGTRSAELQVTLAQMGLIREERVAAMPLVTQTSENGQLRIENAPAALAGLVQELSPLDAKVGQVSRLRIEFEEANQRSTE